VLKRRAHYRPVFTSATGQAVFVCSLSPERERAERLAEKPLPRPPASQAGSPHAVRKVNGTRAVAQLLRAKVAQTEPGLGSSFSAAFRTRMDLSACWMSQGLQLAPTPPVRAY
jgi:hypothetical protein